MQDFLDFFKTDLAIAISWLCTVGSLLFSFFLKIKNRKLKSENMTLNATIKSKNSLNNVNQNGSNNVYTKSNSGDMNINM